MATEKDKINVIIVDYDPNCDEHYVISNYEFDNLETAKCFLQWSWEDWYNSDETEDINEERSYHEEMYAVLKHYCGWKVEWFCTGTNKIPDKFFNAAEHQKM